MRSYSVSLFLGSVDSKSGKSYTKSDLRAAILSFQSSPDVKRWPPEGFFTGGLGALPQGPAPQGNFFLMGVFLL